MNILMMFNGVNEHQLLTDIKKDGGITNFDILSQIMPPLSMKHKTKACKEGDDAKTSNAVIEIQNGKYIRGQMDKSVLGARTKGLLQRVCNDFGNLAQRVLTQINKNCEAKVPQPGTFTDADNALLGAAHGLLAKARAEYDEQQFHRALEAQWEVVGAANRYVDEQAPWALKKTDPARMATVLYVLAETIRHLAILAQPVMPQSAARMLDLLAVPEDARSFAALGPSGALKAGTPLPKPEGIFPRHVEEGQAPKAQTEAKAGG